MLAVEAHKHKTHTEIITKFFAGFASPFGVPKQVYFCLISGTLVAKKKDCLQYLDNQGYTFGIYKHILSNFCF